MTKSQSLFFFFFFFEGVKLHTNKIGILVSIIPWVDIIHALVVNVRISVVCVGEINMYTQTTPPKELMPKNVLWYIIKEFGGVFLGYANVCTNIHTFIHLNMH